MVKRSQNRKTLASLAAELGVSRTTVSNAYNHPDQLAPATRRRILAAASAHGYSGPDPTARNLRTRRAGSVGVLLTEHLSYAFEDMASVDFLAGMAEASAGARTTLTLIPAGPDTAGDSNEPMRLIGGAAVDGFVVYSVAAGDAYLEAVTRRGLPVVICDQPTDAGLPFVGIDDYAAIAPAAQALVDAGHRRIAILTIRLQHARTDGFVPYSQLAHADMHVQRARVLGALEVFSRAGIDPESVPVMARHINEPANARAAASLLIDAHPDITAVLCTTDSMALGVIAEAAERGLRVPEDLSVTGFDGIAPALNIGLSTVIQPNKAKGAAAGHLLAQLIDDALDDTPQHSTNHGAVLSSTRRLLPTRFSPGASVSAPRAQ
ncbi:LacI family DNA-binding transcriptional regulator [Corynebacterium flavescens]|uniref:Transcriptional regulator n=1 Tax=Corynebacterium flavescens TaxID=28028 RepID=A0A1L7CP77_CORFL|nr:LacI family DNA-binding transcriptional regulator [Corynebacterium flavescens]APT87621.1 LacI family transcriptional regulator [Corynebacterium flavescens]KAA8720010.1 substrate-binding domain-containing protein [Corynebacterium flavescens]GEB96995.1 transcriptional regulator [Corynebacterium flavescens]